MAMCRGYRIARVYYDEPVSGKVPGVIRRTIGWVVLGHPTLHSTLHLTIDKAKGAVREAVGGILPNVDTAGGSDVISTEHEAERGASTAGPTGAVDTLG